jgi:hypothetical protein
MPAEHLGTLCFHGGPVGGFFLLPFSGPLAIVPSHSRRRRSEGGPQGRDRRQLEVPYVERDRNLHHLPAIGLNAIRAVIFSRLRVGRDVQVHPEAMRLVGGQVERHGTEPCALKRLPSHRMPKGNQRIGIPARLEALVAIRAHGQVELVLPEEPRIGGREHRPVRSPKIGGLDVDAADGDVGADQDLETLPLVAGRGQVDRSALPRQVIAEHAPGLRHGPHLPIGTHAIGRHSRDDGPQKTASKRVHFASPISGVLAG